MQSWIRDIAVAARRLVSTPVFTLAAVLTLALGSGATTAIYTIVDTVLLKPLPYKEPDRLVRVFGATPDNDRSSTSMPDYHDYMRQSRTLESIGGFVRWSFNLTGDGTAAQRVWGANVTANLFETLQAKPVLGRTFLTEEDRPGGNQVTILSYGLWQSLFAGSPDVIGKTLRLEDVEHTIVGIMPQGFEFPSDARLWVPFGFAPDSFPRELRFLRLVGRMAPGTSVEQAQLEMDAIAGRLQTAYPDSNTQQGVRVVSLREHLVGDVRPALLVLLGAAGFLLLIACANVANLLLARFYQRQGETALRRALGASRAHLFGAAFTEALLISAAGAALGLALAAVGVRVLVALNLAQENPSFLADRLHDVPRLDQIGIDGRVVAFAALAGLATAVLVSLLPALHLSERSLMRVLTGVGKGDAGSGLRLRAGFVVAQVALALTLVIGAGLMIRSFSRLLRLDPGFRSDHVVTFQLSLPRAKYPEGPQVTGFYKELLRRIEALPGVVSAGAAWNPPFGGLRNNVGIVVEGRPAARGQEPEAVIQPVTPGFFETLGISLVQGRSFTEQDTAESLPVAVVNQTLARRFWPGQSPVGRKMTFGGAFGPSGYFPEVPREVVGVVADFKSTGLGRETDPEIYFPHQQVVWRSMSAVVRTQGDPLALADELRQEVWTLDPSIAVFQLRTMDEVVSQSVARPRLNTGLLTAFAVISLVLAAIGVYGLISYSVSLRSSEIGLRMALGAQRRDILWQMLREGAALTAVGLVVGTLVALALTRSLAALLFEIAPTDPLTFASVALLLLAVTLLASYLPARRATRVDPLVALRDQRVVKALGLALAALVLVAAANDPAPLTRLDETQLEIQRLSRPFGLPLNNPPAVAAADATHMKPDDLVFGVAVGNRFRAYPQWVLIAYHVVNDTIGPYALVLNHCEVCSAAAAFRAEVEIGKSGPVPLGFRMCGISKGSFDICDDVTTSRWQPFLGLAEHGPLQGVTLTRLPVTIEDWKSWSERFPETDVVVMSRSIEDREHGRGFTFGAPGVPGPFRAGANLGDTRLPENAIVFGLAADGQAVAVPLDSLGERGAARTVSLGSRRYLVFRSSRHGANAFELPAGSAAYRTAGGEPFALESDAGGRWDELGRPLPGSKVPGDLPVASGYLTEWYEWVSVFPKTGIAR